jgi:hypothetical protein
MSSHLNIHGVRQGTRPLGGLVHFSDGSLSFSLAFMERHSASDYPVRHTVTVFLEDLDAALDVAEWLERTSRDLHRLVQREKGAVVFGESVPPGEVGGGDASDFPTCHRSGV